MPLANGWPPSQRRKWRSTSAPTRSFSKRCRSDTANSSSSFAYDDDDDDDDDEEEEEEEELELELEGEEVSWAGGSNSPRSFTARRRVCRSKH